MVPYIAKMVPSIAQLNDQTVLFLTIQLGISHLFAHSLKVKLTH